MPTDKTKSTAGLDSALVAQVDWKLAIERIKQDIRSDFIYAPHIRFIYRYAADALIDSTIADLKSGRFSPGLPITIEVPKSSRVRAWSKKRHGPNFSRPGSILLPRDRLLYQALADSAAPIIDGKTDHTRSFSHRLAAPNHSSMFLPTRICWGDLQKSLTAHAAEPQHKYLLKLDVANCFGSINQHHLINTLVDAKYDKGMAGFLEFLLVQFAGERNSRGIIQGVYPSDLFGNFYLSPVDRALADSEIASARYVDDLYIFLESSDQADRVLRSIVPLLRSYDLTLNEGKCALMLASNLATEEPDLEKLFADAVEEMAQQLDEDDSDGGYGFQQEWEDDESDSDSEDLELEATKKLFDSIPDYPGQEENIERFCLPLFRKAGSDHALKHVLDSFPLRPSMAQIYCSYIANFLDNAEVYKSTCLWLKDPAMQDWQRLWLLAALLQVKAHPDSTVKIAVDLLRDYGRHETLRATAAMFIGRFGDHTRRKELSANYGSCSPYIQAAIYFSSRFFPTAERRTANLSWSGHSPLHELIQTGNKNQK